MKLIEGKHSYFIKGFFPEGVLCGFTKRNLSGLDVAGDINKIAVSLGASFSLAYLNQIHSSRIRFVKRKGLYTGDGLFTNGNRIILIVRTADCLPLFFYDERKGTVGLVHLGWRPALDGILDNPNLKFAHLKIIAGIGLRKCCYRVGDEFLQHERFVPFLKRHKKILFFDPISFIKKQVIDRGGDATNVKDLKICSFCNNSVYSFRRENTQKRTLSFIIKL